MSIAIQGDPQRAILVEFDRFHLLEASGNTQTLLLADGHLGSTGAQAIGILQRHCHRVFQRTQFTINKICRHRFTLELAKLPLA